MWVVQFLAWLVELLKFLANRSSLHVTVDDVYSYDTSDADFFFYPVTGWHARCRGRQQGSAADHPDPGDAHRRWGRVGVHGEKRGKAEPRVRRG